MPTISTAGIGLISGLFLIQAISPAQSYPGQYPPNQYPPGQYPPGQYPQGQYPPGQYPPGQNPNSLPMGIPMPNIHFPKRKAKAEGTGSSKVEVASINGTLRKLGEKDLLLETGSASRVLRFRLIAKTQFLDKNAKPMRDSLLHPGDRLTIDTNPDDPETVIHVILSRAATKLERENAEATVDEAKIVTPGPDDFGRTHSVAAEPAAATPSASTPATPATVTDEGERPTIRRKDPDVPPPGA